MRPTSFRQDAHPPPPRYRTPSPPRTAFEPISPGSAIAPNMDTWWSRTDDLREGYYTSSLHQQKMRAQERVHSFGNQSNMDAFASIALATTPRDPPTSEHFVSSIQERFTLPTRDYQEGRPAKRKRSEQEPSLKWSLTEQTKATTLVGCNENIPENRLFEAELLLGFSQAARIATLQLAPVAGSNEPVSHQPSSPTKALDVPEEDLRYRSSRNEDHDKEPEASAENPVVTPQETSHDADIHSENAVVEEQNREATPLDASHDIRLQLLEASQTLNYQEPSKPEPTESETPLPLPSISLQEGPIEEAETVQQAEEDPNHSNSTPEGFVAESPIEKSNHSVEDQPQSYREPSENQEPKDEVQEIQVGIEADARPMAIVNADEGTASSENDAHPSELQDFTPDPAKESDGDTGDTEAQQITTAATCAACQFERGSVYGEADSSSTSWINCDGCKSWFHFACAGFKSEREVRGIDKFRCRKCKPIYGSTTYVRKSSRAHTAIDYAGLNQGVLKTSDENSEHHYIRPIKEGTISFQPETFARMRPELVTAEYFEKGGGMKEPIVIPARFNPRPPAIAKHQDSPNAHSGKSEIGLETSLSEDWFPQDPEHQSVPDHGQDALDMVMPQGLTVRKVAELFGLDEKIEVIDVKSQNGESKKWNMRRWADYYESTSDKAVRNVISLEVSQSKLGRLIRRPQIVRDLDLQDEVWPAELQAKGEYPRVQFYCLMSVADCFTDFHIDFGGSSVFYHILKGRKTFFFIPPKEKHLKKYEAWCMSPAQNWTFLGDQTKECCRVDLAEGDTMLIPAGWIHAVWTPEDSLVIGGNFLTRLNYGMQLRISQIEKATGVARKFRYPQFQKIQWYTALRYLEHDPLPKSVQETLQHGAVFPRQDPPYHDFDAWGENSRAGAENYQVRYYSQAELDGLPELLKYLLRTALIDSGGITEGITNETRNAVKKSIPRGFGEPLDIVKKFAMWCAWKRGNETLPQWSYPDANPSLYVPESAPKSGAAANKKTDREAALSGPRRQSARKHSQSVPASNVAADQRQALPSETPTAPNTSVEPQDNNSLTNSVLGKRKAVDSGHPDQIGTPGAGAGKQRRVSSGAATGSHRKTACESCRKRRRACKHKGEQLLLSASSTKDEVAADYRAVTPSNTMSDIGVSYQGDPQPSASANEPRLLLDDRQSPHDTGSGLQGMMINMSNSIARHQNRPNYIPGQKKPRDIFRTIVNTQPSRGRSKACSDCRKSKRRCVHDENGKEDPVKMREAAIPRPTTTVKRRKLDADGQDIPIPKKPKLLMPSDAGIIQTLYPEGWKRGATSNQELAPTAVMTTQSPFSSSESTQDVSTNHALQQADYDDPLIDPQLQNMQFRAASEVPDDLLLPLATTEQRPIDLESRLSEVEFAPISSSSYSNKYELAPDLGHETSFERPAESSLVSPPASSHEDGEQVSHRSSPKLPEFASSSMTSRDSSQHITTVQRITPESGTTGRDSSSNDAAATLVNGPTTPTMPSFSPDMHASDSAQGRYNKARTESMTGADEESLRLIKELQAQEHGLRKRGRLS